MIGRVPLPFRHMALFGASKCGDEAGGCRGTGGWSGVSGWHTIWKIAAIDWEEWLVIPIAEDNLTRTGPKRWFKTYVSTKFSCCISCHA